MREFLLILRGDGMNHLSPDELQALFSNYQKWVAELGEQYIAGQRLEDKGALLSDSTEEVLTDGPFLASKEIIAGYFMIQAADQEEANEIAKRSPHLGLYQIEVRPLVFPKMK